MEFLNKFMKVAQITPSFYPIVGGVERHVLQISKLLQKQGYDVEILTSHTRKGETKNYEVMFGIKVFRFRIWGSLGDFGKIWPGFTFRLLKGNYDLIHVHNYRHFHTLIALIISKIKKIPCVLTTHSPFHPSYVRKRLISRLFVSFYDRILRNVIDKFFSKVIVITSSEKKYFIHLPAEKLCVVPNGISSEYFSETKKEVLRRIRNKFKISKKDTVFLFVGRIHPTKGLEFLLQALSKIRKIDYKLIIAGPIVDRRYYKKLVRLIRKIGLRKKIIFTGFIDEKEKIGLYDVSKIILLPSIYEPFGIVILEAFARGKPVIAVDSDGPRFLIKNGENGFLVKYGDQEKLVECIKLLLRSKELYEKIRVNNRRKAKQFTWDKIVKKLIKIYEEVSKKNT